MRASATENNDILKKILDDFTTPYNNNKVIELLTKINSHFVDKSEELQNYLITKKGKADLSLSYSIDEITQIKEFVNNA